MFTIDIRRILLSVLSVVSSQSAEKYGGDKCHRHCHRLVHDLPSSRSWKVGRQITEKLLISALVPKAHCIMLSRSCSLRSWQYFLLWSSGQETRKQRDWPHKHRTQDRLLHSLSTEFFPGLLDFHWKSVTGMVCAEKTHLQDVLAVAIARHARIVKALHSTTGMAFNEALKEATLAKQEAEIAKVAVDEHRGTHGCWCARHGHVAAKAAVGGMPDVRPGL
jgi:hypothetical protein